MIKVNLNSPNVPSIRSNIGGADEGVVGGDDQIQRQGIIRLVILALGPIALFIYQNNMVIPDKTAELAQKDKTVTELKTKNDKAKSAVDETKKFQGDQAKLQAQIDSIEDLRKDRMQEVRVLDLIQRELPERVWLNKLELRDHKLTVVGMAGNDGEITQLMDTMTKSSLLAEVNLISTAEKTVDGNLIKEFTLSCSMLKTENPALKAKPKPAPAKPAGGHS